jgi:PAS domain-containing protein
VSESVKDGVALDEIRRRKAMFDSTWNLATVLAATLAILAWYFELARIDVGAVIWCLAALGLALFGLSAQTYRARTRAGLKSLALWSQLLGTVVFGVAWHLFGGVQQPIFALFVLLPLITGSLLFGFWEHAVATSALVAVLLFSVLFSPEMSSFLEERYGLPTAHAWSAWLPHGRVAFVDLGSSPTHDVLLTSTLVVLVVAVSTTARALASICARAVERERSLEYEVARLQELAKQLVTHAPAAEALVQSSSGRIVNASDRFIREFDGSDAAGDFFLDRIDFAYPAVIKRLLAAGGEEIQGATVRGRDVVLRVRAEIMGSGERQVATINIERCDDMCWRGEVDSLDEPVFAINARGEIAFLNRTALSVFGEDADGASATQLFSTGTARWWDIAPLESARRPVERRGRRYIASIRRKRIADTIGELAFVHLQEAGKMHAVAAS